MTTGVHCRGVSLLRKSLTFGDFVMQVSTVGGTLCRKLLILGVPLYKCPLVSPLVINSMTLFYTFDLCDLSGMSQPIELNGRMSPDTAFSDEVPPPLPVKKRQVSHHT